LIARLTHRPIYPLLFAAYPILALFAQNAGEVRAIELVELLALAVAGTVVTWLVFALLLKDVAKAALVLAVAILMFYTLDRLIEPTREWIFYMSTFWVKRAWGSVSPLWILVPEVFLLCGFAFGVVRRLKNLQGVTRFLNALAIIAVTMTLIRVATVKAPAATRPPRVAAPLAQLTPSAATRPLDIYYIILDGYARHDVMKSHFAFDNSAFLEHLERQGFFVARNSTANYCQTPLSLSASLNATYLDELVRGLGNDQTELSDVIGRNDVLATLRPLGYRFVTFATGFEPTEHPEADRYLSARPYTTEFQRMVIDMTPARVVWPDPKQLDQFAQARERILFLLDHLPDVARDPAPTFTFAHFLCPHQPIIFGPNGEDIGHENEKFMQYLGHKTNGRFPDADGYRRYYRDQAAYLTCRIRATIDRILAESPEPPIIIIQSDHGSELNLDMMSVENTDLHERMSILNAYSFPGGRYEGLYDSISPVNSFRVVLNTFFGARLPLLPDKSYFSTWPDPYRFIDVTRSVRSDEPDALRVVSPQPGPNRDDS
jgi:hypothetical protein